MRFHFSSNGIPRSWNINPDSELSIPRAWDSINIMPPWEPPGAITVSWHTPRRNFPAHGTLKPRRYHPSTPLACSGSPVIAETQANNRTESESS